MVLAKTSTTPSHTILLRNSQTLADAHDFNALLPTSTHQADFLIISYCASQAETRASNAGVGRAFNEGGINVEARDLALKAQAKADLARYDPRAAGHGALAGGTSGDFSGGSRGTGIDKWDDESWGRVPFMYQGK